MAPTDKAVESTSIESGPRFEAWAKSVEARMNDHDWQGIEHEDAMNRIDQLIDRIEKEQRAKQTGHLESQGADRFGVDR